MVEGDENPLVRATGGWVTRTVWQHPLWQAVRDMEDRLGVQQGELAAEPGDDPARDPVADHWVSVTQAATRKGVTRPGLHKAIARGDVIARPIRPNHSWLEVSANSLDAWQPMAVRQHARRAAPRAKQGRQRQQAAAGRTLTDAAE